MRRRRYFAVGEHHAQIERLTVDRSGWGSLWSFERANRHDLGNILRREQALQPHALERLTSELA